MHFRAIIIPIGAALISLAPSAAWAEQGGVRGDLEIDWFSARDPDRDIPWCILLPYPSCRQTLDVSVGYGGGGGWGLELEPDESNDFMQLYIDLAYLFRVVASPSIQVGPTVGFELELFDETMRYHWFATGRGRIWAGRWVTFELALGLVVSLDESWGYQGVGGLGEVAITIHGHLGAYVQGQLIAGADGDEARLTAGFRGSFLTWLAILIGVFA